MPTKRLVSFSAWNAKISTSVASSARTVIGWNLGRKRVSNQALPLWRRSKARLRLPRASGTTMKIPIE
jgi:hypothetical protein